MGKEIRIIKKDKITNEDYTFIGDAEGLPTLNTISQINNTISSKNDKNKGNLDKLRIDPKKGSKVHLKSRITGGHGLQGHSPVYE